MKNVVTLPFPTSLKSLIFGDKLSVADKAAKAEMPGEVPA